MTKAALRLLASFLFLAPGPPSVPGQQGIDVVGTAGILLQAADSVESHSRARSAQRVFERTRRANMPSALGGGGGPCDDVVGRMCWRHGPGSLWTPEPENESILQARTTLLEELEHVGSLYPGDEWVLGQRVWYLLEAGRASEAAALARSCGGSVRSWWCAALEGLALHVEGRYPQAEALFERALTLMDPARRSQWEDVRVLLDRDGRDAIEEAGARSVAEANEVVVRMWHLSDPLRLVPGNDRRTEHFARHALAHIRSDSVNPYGISWGDDLTELLVRYGWEVGWERVKLQPGTYDLSTNVLGHEHPDGRTYLVPGRALTDPAAADMTPSRSFRPSSYAPAYAPVVLPMGSEVVILTRGDHAIVGASFRLPVDTTFRGMRGLRTDHAPPRPLRDAPLQAGAFVHDERGELRWDVREEGRREGVLVLEAPAGLSTISVEVFDPAAGLAGRLRRGLEVPVVPPDIATLSPLILLSPGPEPADAEEALGRMNADGTVAPGEAIQVTWEIWGLGWREEVLQYRLSVEGLGGGFFRRAGEALGLLGRERPIALSWEEPGPSMPGPTLRTVSMDLPVVDEGEYMLRLEVISPGRETLLSERRIRVVEGG